MSQSTTPDLHAEAVLALLATGQWSVTRTSADAYSEQAWQAARLEQPFWDANGTRYWHGPTAYAALLAAHAALSIKPDVMPARKSLIETQLGLYFAVGPAGDEADDTNSERQTKSFAALEKILNERGMAELGQSDPTVSRDFRFVPVELCECEWDGMEVDGEFIYSVWFTSGRAVEPAAAAKLRAMALEAYTAVCGADARFVRAELYSKWTVATRTPYIIES